MNRDSRGVDREQYPVLLQSVTAALPTTHFASPEASSNALVEREREDTKGCTARS